MKYKLTEQYFETLVFQQVVQNYFDTVLKGILSLKPVIQAKGLFVANNEVKADLHDMPYHIHILNGLIPALFVYEQFCKQRGLLENPEIEKYLKTFILGFTFHDADKLTEKSWDNALDVVEQMDSDLHISEFFPEFKQHKGDVFFISLGTEDRTEVMKNRYKTSLDYSHLNEILAPLCNFADGLASIQELDGVETFYKEAQKTLDKITQIYELPLSFVKIHENPYTLLSQNLLNATGKVLNNTGRKILYTMRDGILFFGNDLKENEKQQIFDEFEGGNDDIDIEKLITITSQQCDFSSIIPIGIDKEIIDQIIEKFTNSFLQLSPNGSEKIQYFDDFVKFNEALIEAAELPINVDIQSDKIYLRFSENAMEEFPEFVKIFALQKIIWLNSKANKVWGKDFKTATDSEEDFSFELQGEFQVSDEETISLSKISDLKKYFSFITNSQNALLKNYVAIAKTVNAINSFEDEDEQEEYIEKLYNDLINTFASNYTGEKSVLSELYNKFFTHKGNRDFQTIIENIPHVPVKKKMCAYTGTIGTEKYVASVAFGMNARGFSNRTVASLQNTTSFVSKLMAEENKLRKSSFKRAKSNHVIYYDFFETTLDISPDIIQNCIESRNHSASEDGVINFDKAAKFQPTNRNLEFVEIGSDMISAIWLIRNSLIIIKNLNIRMYITGIMSPYRSHKETFVYENAPRFVKDLGWNKVRLNEINNVLDEIDLLFALGKSKRSINSGLVLKYAENHNSIFKAFYEFKMRKEQQEVANASNKLKNFIIKYPHKFKNMTTIEKLVDVALKIQSSAKSGSEETRLIREALDFIRKNRKENRDKEHTIQQIGGNIHKTLRQERIKSDIIQEFARLVYEELYEKEWKGNLPSINRQKDWIYQFGFVYKMKVDELINERSDEKIIKNLKEKNLEPTPENIKAQLSDKQQYFAETITKRILEKVN
ncbi:MAG: hypothetical protein ACOCQ4_00455 [bacterium]